MKRIGKTKQELVKELQVLHTRVAALERSEAERKQAEEALQNLSARQQALLAAIPEIIIEVDANKIYTWANQAGLEFFGEDVIGREASYYFEGEQDTYQRVRPLFNGDENVIYVESWQRRKDGEKRLLAWWCRVLKDASGQVTGALSSARDITARRRAEEALRESEEKYRTLVERANDGIAIIQDGIAKYVNSRLTAMWGGSVGEIIGTPFTNYVHPDERSTLLERYKRRMAGEAIPATYETALQRKDGSKVYAELNAGIVIYEGRSADLVIVRDITERKRAEEALRQRSEELATVLDALPVFVWISLDPECRVMTGNRAANELIGAAPGTNVSQTTAAVGNAVYLRQLKKDGSEYQPEELPMQRAIALGQPVCDVEIEFRFSDGRQAHMLGSAAPLFTAQGQVRGVVAAYMDITGRVQAQEALQQSAARLETMHAIDQATLAMQPMATIAETTLAGIRRLAPCWRASVALFDPTTGEGTLLAVQADGATRLAAGTRIPSEMLRDAGLLQGQIQVVEDVLNLSHRPPVIQALQAEGLRSYVNVPLLAGDELFGTLNLAADRPAAFTAEQVAIARQVADQLAIAIQQARLREQVQRHTAELEQRVAERTAELSETAARLSRREAALQAANEKLKELDQLKSQFVANVSHELRTPLTNIKAYLHLLERGKPEKHAQYMTTLHSETNHLEHLIEDLLDISRLDQGKIRIRLAAVDVNRVMAMLVDARALLVKQAGLTLEVLPQPELPPALADADRLMQVLINLLANATNYTPQGGTITLRTGLQQAEGRAWVTVAVSDTGLGIAPKELPHIFERFYRGTAAQQRNVPGTGLGLAICQEIVQRHGGQITVESQVEAGSTFTVWLPAATHE